MKSYKAQILANGSYGYLPSDFVSGYEDHGEKVAYFQLHEGVKFPEGAEVQEIEESEFQQKLEELSERDRNKRAEDEAKLIEHIQQEKSNKEAEMKDLKRRLAFAENALLNLLSGGK